MKWLLPLVALLAAAPAAAGGAAQAFAEGRFAEAATLGRKERTAEGLVAAGRAASTMGAFQTADRARARALLLDAEADFTAALAVEPGRPDAELQRAIAKGYRAKLDNSLGLARQVRREFEGMAARRPNDALVLGALGGWHGESVATLGKFLAGTALGAREGEAFRWFERAVAAPGADPVVPIFYATTLLNLSAGNAPRARALLARSLKAAPSDGFERLMQANARAILKPLDAGDTAAARATARRLAPLGTLG